MKEIKLTQGQVALVDDEDFEWLNQHKWFALWNPRGNHFYAVRKEYLGKIDGSYKSLMVRMHRQILGLEHGDPRKGDHKEPSETLNNTRDNLRIAKTDSESNANQRLRKDNLSGFKGVRKRGSGYEARIAINGVRKHLGTRSTPEAAYHELWVPAALEVHGEFARLA